MNIYIVRHTIAASLGNEYNSAITEQGRMVFAKNLEFWSSVSPRLDLVISSPLPRALETAEMIHKHFELPFDVITERELEPGASTELVVALANSLNKNDIAFVGHLPDVAYHVSNLISISGANVVFLPGNVAKISFDGEARLRTGFLEFLIGSTK
jgi:phosphohistidine phosphatase